MENILDIKKKKLHIIEEDIIRYSQDLGWADPTGSFDPLIREQEGDATQFELKRIDSRTDNQKGIEVIRLLARKKRLKREIAALEERQKASVE